LFPATPKECFELTADSFDLAERLQTPIILLTDLDLGMNEHICDELEWDDQRTYDRGKVISAKELDEAKEAWGRYLDVDGDGIPYRSIPGTHPEKGAYFNRGTSRDEYAIYTEKGEVYERNMRRLEVKWATAPQYLPKPITQIRDKQNSIGIIHFGTSMEAVHEALDTMQKNGQIANDLRILAFPFQAEVIEFIEQHDTVFVVEQNRDAQFKTLIVNELQVDPKSLNSILHFNGDPINANVVISGINEVLLESSTQKESSTEQSQSAN